MQHSFCPLVIREYGNHVEVAGTRLPFISESDRREGGFAVVTRVQIAREHLRLDGRRGREFNQEVRRRTEIS